MTNVTFSHPFVHFVLVVTHHMAGYSRDQQGAHFCLFSVYQEGEQESEKVMEIYKCATSKIMITTVKPGLLSIR